MDNTDVQSSLVRLTAPLLTDEPVSVDEVVAQAKIDRAATVKDAGLIALYLRAAREYVEAKSRQVLAISSWQLLLDSFAIDPIPIDIYPVIAVQQIHYYDLNNAFLIVDPTAYNVDVKTSPARVKLAYGQVWPYTAIARPNSVIVEFTAGFGPGLCPPTLKLGVLMLAAEWYMRRTPVTELNLATVPFGIDSLIAPTYRGVYV